MMDILFLKYIKQLKIEIFRCWQNIIVWLVARLHFSVFHSTRDSILKRVVIALISCVDYFENNCFYLLTYSLHISIKKKKKLCLFVLSYAIFTPSLTGGVAKIKRKKNQSTEVLFKSDLNKKKKLFNLAILYSKDIRASSY